MKFTRRSCPAELPRLTILCSTRSALLWPLSRCGYGSADELKAKRKYPQSTQRLPDKLRCARIHRKNRKKQKARSGLPERAAKVCMANRCLALYFGHFFLLGFSFLFLELELRTAELDDGDLGVVADAVPRMDDAGVAAGAIREFRRDLAEQLLRDGRKHDVRCRLTARLQRVALAEGDHLLRDGTRGFGAGQCGGDAPVFQ